MNTLEKIILHKKEEVKKRKKIYSVELLETSVFFNSPTVSLKDYVLRKDKCGVIAEFKRRSPSKGMINAYAEVERTTIGYMQAGASALSILTDVEFFGGKNEDLAMARKFNFCPILRKDFVVDEYQILEARSIGADAVLLLADVLTKQELKRFIEMAHQLGLEVLLELYDEKFVDKAELDADLIGVNNRNLQDFKINKEHAIKLLNMLPEEKIKIAESGIHSVNDLILLRDEGFNGFLIGTLFMQASRPEKACHDFIKELRAYDQQKLKTAFVYETEN